MTFSIWILALAVFLSGAVVGVFVALVVGIHTGGRGRRLTDQPGTHLDALTRSVLGVGVRTNVPAGNSGEGMTNARS